MRILKRIGNYQIVEYPDVDFSIENLKGDLFNASLHPNIPAEVLKAEENDFENLVKSEGVFGYSLECWDTRTGEGYEPVDSCWGFVGQYREDDDQFNHSIVKEFEETILERRAKEVDAKTVRIKLNDNIGDTEEMDVILSYSSLGISISLPQYQGRKNYQLIFFENYYGELRQLIWEDASQEDTTDLLDFTIDKE
jgi:hypothetical protein